jgi:hypothetical protein
MVSVISGPVASGKSTIARELARGGFTSPISQISHDYHMHGMVSAIVSCGNSPSGIRRSSMANRLFSRGEARDVGERIGIDWQAGKVDLEQFRLGLMVELEHGTVSPATDVTHDDELLTGKIALAHLNEIADYYKRLAAMEKKAKS